jgi:hypothetical protein
LRAHGLQRFTHAQFGPISLEHTSFAPDGNPHLRVIICTPKNAATRQVMTQINAKPGGGSGGRSTAPPAQTGV